MQRYLESSHIRIKAVLTQGTRRVAGSRQRCVLTPQRCPEGTIFTIISSSLLGHPRDTEYTSTQSKGLGSQLCKVFSGSGRSEAPRLPL